MELKRKQAVVGGVRLYEKYYLQLQSCNANSHPMQLFSADTNDSRKGGRALPETFIILQSRPRQRHNTFESSTCSCGRR